MANTHPLKKLWETFGLYTTTHGMFYIVHYVNPWKSVWSTLVTFFVAITAWSTYTSVRNYSQYKVSVSTTYEVQNDLQFPSVTFCNEFQLSKSTLGSNNVISMAFITTLTDRKDETALKFEKTETLCKSNDTAENNLTMDGVIKLGTVGLVKLFTRDSFKSVVKCWWNNAEFSCDGNFMNHWLDVGSCFTFLSNKTLVHDNIYSDYAKVMYGLNESAVTDKRLTNVGPSTGLKLLLNVGQEDQCDVINLYAGDGFRVIVHDANEHKPSFLILPSILLLPGFEINVILKGTEYSRRTSHLGYCQEPNYVKNGKKFYGKTDCFNRCFIKRVFLNCRCFIEVAIGMDDFFTDFFHFNVSTYELCNVGNFSCINNERFLTFIDENLSKNCPECIQACYEMKYDYISTYKKLSKLEDFSGITSKGQNISDIRKNYLVVKFFFDSTTIMKVVETQAFTTKDLFIYIGNAIGLFLGMSFMTFGEIIQLVSQCSCVIAENVIEKSSNWFKRRNNRIQYFHGKTKKIAMKNFPSPIVQKPVI